MSVAIQFIIDVDRETGQPLWWKNLIEAHTERGYEVRCLNYYYTYNNESEATSNSFVYWDRNEYSAMVKYLNSSIREKRQQAVDYFYFNIKFFLSRIDGVDADSVKVEYDALNREQHIYFDAEVIEYDIAKDYNTNMNVDGKTKNIHIKIQFK